MASGDTALWLHNKLGSTDDLWSGKTICAQLTLEKLKNIHGCFHTLQPHVKVKLMLSFLHIPRRNVDMWKVDLEKILSMAINDTDQWVSMVGEILRPYPATGSLNLELEDNNNTFAEVLSDLRKLVKKTADVRMLPMECQFLNKTAMIATTGQQPQPIKHFALKRKPKSATLRAELLQKSTEVANNKKSNGSNSLPIKVRSFAKKMDDTTPLKGFSSRPPSSGVSGGFISPTVGMKRPGLMSTPVTPLGGAPLAQRSGSVRKEGGIKLLDITEMPVGAKEAKRRRKLAEMEAVEQQKKDKDAEKTLVASGSTVAPYTPDYAAGLVAPATPKLPVVVGSSPASLPSQSVSYIPSANARLPSPLASFPGVPSVTQQARENLSQQLQQQLGLGQSQIRTQPAGQSQTTVQLLTNNVASQPLPGIQQLLQPNTAQASVSSQIQPTGTLTQQPPRKGLSLTREQMMEAQEMFRTSNKVTRPEKALILGFMAGSRENPCPQQGNILSIRLSENKEIVMQTDGIQKTMCVDTFFQMNYATGEWKRVKKYREVED
ncbi:hypothetical protein CHS0354_020758 [Potamilus streckersoni]|uniref:HDAg domain-containing protein n=1 Tax=Potamilus streckersoni TaxID=2493646 RepID=A0AAE0SCZ7_9BIVA|nr:hypothetical protein CHS0354_020758 [Potamilus streckersoni]